jgi:hypothetical protein
MTVEVEIDIFSGMPNPEWRLPDTQAQELLERLSALPPTDACPRPGNLGYRGLIVRVQQGTRQSMHIHNGCAEMGDGAFFVDPDRGLERWLVATGHAILDREILDVVETALG